MVIPRFSVTWQEMVRLITPASGNCSQAANLHNSIIGISVNLGFSSDREPAGLSLHGTFWPSKGVSALPFGPIVDISILHVWTFSARYVPSPNSYSRTIPHTYGVLETRSPGHQCPIDSWIGDLKVYIWISYVSAGCLPSSYLWFLFPLYAHRNFSTR